MRRTFVVLSVVVALSLSGTSAVAAATVDPPITDSAQRTAVELSMEVDGTEHGPEGGSLQDGVSARAVSVFTSHADHPHTTYTSGFKEVSAHGWWLKGTTKATKAKVTVTLQALTQAGWRTVAKGSRVVGPGTSTRGNARVKCVNNDLYHYRSIVDVDLVGYLDDSAVVGAQTPSPVQCGFAW